MALFKKSKKNITAYIHCKGKKIAKGIETMITPTITMLPMSPLIEDTNNMRQQLPMIIKDRASALIWERKIELIQKRQLVLQMGTVHAYTLICSQCSLTTRSKLEKLSNYNALNANNNPVELLTEMRNILYGCESHQ